MTLKQTSPLTDIQVFKDQTLGVGSFGKVCRARYGSLPCAAKLIHETLFDPKSFKLVPQEKKHRLPFKRFEQECEVLHNLRHPNIVQYLGVYQDPDTKLPVLLMELMDGNLTHFLKDSLLQQQQIPVHIQVSFCHDVALALSFLHDNKVIHRDLSSNNILLISNVRAKVTDFGMARLHSAGEQATQYTSTSCPGTDVYMPPEAVTDKPMYTEKIDCFSLGVLIIQILTQLFPAPGARQEKLNTLQRGRKMAMTIPEVDRRKNHIDLVNPNHPLLAIALDCLNDVEYERPSAQQICERVAALKESAEYTKSTKGAKKEEKLVNNSVRDTKQKVNLTSNLREVAGDEILHLKELIHLKDETIAAKEKEIEELRKQLADKDQESAHQQEKPPQRDKGLLYYSDIVNMNNNYKTHNYANYSNYIIIVTPGIYIILSRSHDMHFMINFGCTCIINRLILYN